MHVCLCGCAWFLVGNFYVFRGFLFLFMLVFIYRRYKTLLHKPKYNVYRYSESVFKTVLSNCGIKLPVPQIRFSRFSGFVLENVKYIDVEKCLSIMFSLLF